MQGRTGGREGWQSPIELRVCEDQIATNPIDNGHVHRILGFHIHNQTNVGFIELYKANCKVCGIGKTTVSNKRQCIDRMLF